MRKKKFLKRLKGALVKTLILALAMTSLLQSVNTVQAASLTSMSDTLTRLKASTNANHTIQFISPTGVAAGQTITLTFTGFVTSTVNAIAFGDVDFAEGNTSCASFSEKTLAASPSGATWGISASSGVITITSGTGTTTAGNCLRVKIGTNAVTGTTGTNQIQNNTAGSATIAIAGTFTDTGTIAIPIISNDQVTVTATVDPTITFSISTNSASFGSLSAATGRWATGSGANASAGTDPTSSNTAHTLTVGTNATSGYTVTYNGATLTSGSNTIAVATISADSDGTPGSNQFAMCGKGTSGSPTVVSSYLCATNASYNFVASTDTTFFSATAPASSDVVSVAYLANIASSKAAGSYSTTITFIATGNF